MNFLKTPKAIFNLKFGKNYPVAELKLSRYQNNKLKKQLDKINEILNRYIISIYEISNIINKLVYRGVLILSEVYVNLHPFYLAGKNVYYQTHDNYKHYDILEITNDNEHNEDFNHKILEEYGREIIYYFIIVAQKAIKK